MTELQFLQSEKARIESTFNELNPIDMNTGLYYMDMMKRISTIEEVRFLISSCPGTMNPDKIKSHLNMVFIRVKPSCSIELYAQGVEFFKNFKATDCNSYPAEITRFLVGFLAEGSHMTQNN